MCTLLRTSARNPLHSKSLKFKTLNFVEYRKVARLLSRVQPNGEFFYLLLSQKRLPSDNNEFHFKHFCNLPPFYPTDSIHGSILAEYTQFVVRVPKETLFQASFLSSSAAANLTGRHFDAIMMMHDMSPCLTLFTSRCG